MQLNFHLSPYIMNSWNLELREFENDGMAPSKRHSSSTLVSLIFIFIALICSNINK